MLSFSLIYVGLGGLCLSNTKHFTQVFATPAARHLPAILQVAGWVSVLAGFLLSGASEGWSVGLVAALGHVFLAGLLITGLLAFLPVLLPWLGLILLGAGLSL